MANIMLDGSTYTAIATNHISYTNREYSHTGGGGCNAWDDEGNCTGYAPTYPVYNYPTRYASATITGVINSSANKVYINSKKPIINSDKGVEKDTFTLPSTATTSGSGSHSNASSGNITGNSKNVYVNGKLLVVQGIQIPTHVSGVNATPSGSQSSNVYIS